jgi:2-polyprenyl-3-methyl-5-hydroxy-6-metoxy-1,4-benzoquinol methylase
VAKKLTKSPVKKTAAKKKLRKTSSKKASRASALQLHFETAGTRFDLRPHQVLAQVKKLMSRKRHTEWLSASTARQQGSGRPEAEYRVLESAEQINMLFSLQAQASLKVCEWLSDQVALSGYENGRIGDLGCGSGVLAAWIASRHPQSQVIGWDAMPNFVEAARSSQKVRNLSFATWDYSQSSCPEPHACDVLVTCFGVDFPTRGDLHPHVLDISSIRSGEYYRTMLGLMRSYFRGWRTAAKDQGLLHAVLRIPSDGLFLATIDAAHEEGWDFQVEAYKYLESGAEQFPAMTFRAASAPIHSEEVILSLWCRSAFRIAFAAEIKDAAATCAFKSLVAKTILKEESRTYDDGHTMEAVVGTAGFLGFQYTHATTGFARLKIMSLDEAGTAEPWFPQPAFEIMF